MESRIGLGVELDRILAIVLTGTGLTISVGLGIDDVGFGLLTLFPVIVYGASLWASQWWTLLCFGLMSIPMAFGAYVICDIGQGPLAWGLLHRAHESPVWFFLGLYGLIRALWAGSVAMSDKINASPVHSLEGEAE